VLLSLSRSRRRPAMRHSRFSQLAVERLEDRASPSTLAVAPLFDPGLDPPASVVTDPSPGNVADAPPVATGIPTPPPPAAVDAAFSAPVAAAVAGATPPAGPTAGDSSSAPPAPPPGQSGSGAPVGPPSIVEMQAQPVECLQYTIQGDVYDPANKVGSLTVTIAGDGMAGAQETVAVTPATGGTSFGSFQVTVELQPNTSPYAITHVYTAVAGDGQGRVSAPVTCEITQPGQLLPTQ
jgi:hypothetical protein